MSLAPGERQALARIESQLRRSDPKLAVMLTLFGRRAFRRTGPVRERISPWHPHARRLWLAVMAAATVALGVLFGMAFSSHSTPLAPRGCGSVITYLATCQAGHGAGQASAGGHGGKARVERPIGHPG